MTKSLTGSCVVVTGGAGFIGSHLVQRLLDQGASRVAVVDSLSFGQNCMRVVGAVKILMATLLLVGIWYPPCATIGSTIMATLMLAAVIIHFKVNDPVKKSLPAASLLLLSLIVAYTRGRIF